MTHQDNEKEFVFIEAIKILYESGLLNELSQRSKEYISNDTTLAQAIAEANTPNLDPRLSLEEYTKQIMTIFKVPSNQYQFYEIITKVCYMMIMAEKNPLVAQQLKGILVTSNALQELMDK